MPEYTKRDTAAGCFPGHCFTCIDYQGPFWYLGGAAGYGDVIICTNCVVELGRQQGLPDPGLHQAALEEADDLREQVRLLQGELEEERNSKLKVVSLESAMREIKRRTTPKKKPATTTKSAA